ncbi:MAG: 2-hydroxyacyl-CoA dehydratase family protein [Sporolactobacillus sp.]
MSQVADSIISKLTAVAHDPGKAVKDYIDQTGHKAIGWLPEIVPEEIIYAGGMLPVGCWGGETEINEAKNYLPAFTCSLLMACMEFDANGTYKNLSGIVVPSLCDELKCVGQDMMVASSLPVIQIVPPAHRKIAAGITFLETEYAKMKTKLEAISGHIITEEALVKAIDVYNDWRKTMREFVAVANDHLDVITPLVRHHVIKSAFFMDKAKHAALVKDLIAALKAESSFEFQGKKVVVTGIMAEPDAVLKIFEDNQIAVVGDNLAQETIQFATDVPAEGENAIHRLALLFANIEGLSVAYDPEKKRGQLVLDLAKKNGADGIVFALFKFCCEEEFDYPVMKEEFQAQHVPTLYLEIDQQQADTEQARTRIQAFKETLDMGQQVG